MTPEMRVLAPPPTVRFWPAPPMLPVSVSAPASELIRLALPNVMAPP
jgi:hypothetical protein